MGNFMVFRLFGFVGRCRLPHLERLSWAFLSAGNDGKSRQIGRGLFQGGARRGSCGQPAGMFSRSLPGIAVTCPNRFPRWPSKDTGVSGACLAFRTIEPADSKPA